MALKTSYLIFIVFFSFLLQASRTLAQIMSGISYKLATSVLFPFRMSRYGVELEGFLRNFENKYKKTLYELGISLTVLEQMVNAFKYNTIKFDEKVNSVDRTK